MSWVWGKVMRRRSKAGGKAPRPRARKAAAPRRRAGRKAAGPSVATLRKQLDACTRELSEALEQQAATSDVLRVISSSPGTLEPVFQAILANATQICDAKVGIFFQYQDGAYTA